ncbi:MAG: hypothetical protein WB543_18265 [Candidatus Acidiferrum sp.]
MPQPAGLAFGRAGEARIVFVDGSKARVEYTGAATAVFSDRGPGLQRMPVKSKK